MDLRKIDPFRRADTRDRHRPWSFVRFFGISMAVTAAPVQAVTWQDEIQPLVQKHCTKCHGGVEQEAGLDLRSLEALLKGSDEGPVVAPGDAEGSLLYEMVSPHADMRMPPKGDSLRSEEVALIGQWIAGGLPEKSPQSEATDLPDGLRPRLAIDFLIEKRWKAEGIRPAAPCSDDTYLRRVALDLLGRLPTPAEAETFHNDRSSSKRESLVDRLLTHPDHTRHLANLVDVVLLGRERDPTGRDLVERGPEWRAYLEWAFRENRPWNEIARDLIVARPTRAEERGAAWFLYAQKNNHEGMAKSFAPLLLGKQIQCAQCHDHPVVPEIEQKHYWGLVSFFKRSYNVKTPEGPGLAESAVGGHFKYSNVQGDSFEATLAFLNGSTVEEASPASGSEGLHLAEWYDVPPPAELLQTAADAKDDDEKRRRRKSDPEVSALPVPKQSRRADLAGIALESNPEFAKTMVNRLWALCFGRGLVHPVDHLDSVHPASHPALLEWLGRDFAASGYDVRRFLRECVLSYPYQLEATPAEPAPAEAFAAYLPRPLIAEVLGLSFLVALGHAPDSEGSFSGADEKALLDELIVRYPDVFPETFNPTVREGLYFSNHARVDQLLKMDASPLMQKLGRVETLEEGICLAFESVLGRRPDSEEREASSGFLGDRSDRSAEGFKHLVWALLCSSEFRFNH